MKQNYCAPPDVVRKCSPLSYYSRRVRNTHGHLFRGIPGVTNHSSRTNVADYVLPVFCCCARAIMIMKSASVPKGSDARDTINNQKRNNREFATYSTRRYGRTVANTLHGVRIIIARLSSDRFLLKSLCKHVQRGGWKKNRFHRIRPSPRGKPCDVETGRLIIEFLFFDRCITGCCVPWENKPHAGKFRKSDTTRGAFSRKSVPAGELSGPAGAVIQSVTSDWNEICDFPAAPNRSSTTVIVTRKSR